MKCLLYAARLKSQMFSGFLALMLLAGWGQVVFAEETQVLSAEEIRQKAQDYLLDSLPWDPDAMEVEVDYAGEDLILPKGDLVLDFKAAGKAEKAGRLPVALRVSVDQKFQRRLRLTAMVSVSQDIVKVLRPVKRGDLISEEDVELVTVQRNRLYKNPAIRLEDVVGYQATRSLQSGRVIKLNQVQKPALVEKGEQVTLVVSSGPMKITAPGLSIESGTENSLVRVKNQQSKKIVYGRVIGPNMVEVNY